jgi:hypothetical protein
LESMIRVDLISNPSSTSTVNSKARVEHWHNSWVQWVH